MEGTISPIIIIRGRLYSVPHCVLFTFHLHHVRVRQGVFCVSTHRQDRLVYESVKKETGRRGARGHSGQGPIRVRPQPLCSVWGKP